jgi:uncharacterized protein YjcR
MKPAEAAKLANVNPETARKWKREYERDPEKKIPFKKTNRTSNRAPSQLNENHKMHLIFLMRIPQLLSRMQSKI